MATQPLGRHTFFFDRIQNLSKWKHSTSSYLLERYFPLLPFVSKYTNRRVDLIERLSKHIMRVHSLAFFSAYGSAMYINKRTACCFRFKCVHKPRGMLIHTRSCNLLYIALSAGQSRGIIHKHHDSPLGSDASPCVRNSLHNYSMLFNHLSKDGIVIGHIFLLQIPYSARWK